MIVWGSRAFLEGVLAVVLVALWLLNASSVASADDDDLFRVLDVKVDETDQTAAAAHDKALAAGERRAWDVLLQRLVDPQQKRPLPEFSQAEIGDAVKDFWVSGEKTSAVRYIATLNYNFRPDAVRRALAARNLRFSTTRSKPVVVVPLWTIGNETRPWDEGNPWREAWRGVRSPPLVPLVLLAADAQDASLVGAAQAAGDREKLAEIARRNGGEDVLVTSAAITGSEPASRQMKITSVRYSAYAAQPLPERTLAVEGEETAELFRQAASLVAQDVDAAWRRGTAVAAKPSSKTTVFVPTQSFESWVSLRQRLSALPQVQRVDVVTVNRQEAEVVIVFPGTLEQMNVALARSGLAVKSEDGRLVLSEAADAVRTIDEAAPR